MFYELRQYGRPVVLPGNGSARGPAMPGKMDAWLELMEGEFIPFAVSRGMNITAASRGEERGEEDETVYVWMRRFESEAERERVDAAVYGSDTMNNDIGPRVSDVLAPDGHVVTRIVPTPASLTR